MIPNQRKTPRKRAKITRIDILLFAEFEMAHPEGVEPPTSWSVARHSIQLSYGCTLFYKVTYEQISASTIKGLLNDSDLSEN